MPNWQFCCKNSNGTQFALPIIKGTKKIFTMQKEDKTTKTLIDKIVEGIQEKKGKGITIVDMEKLGNSICDYFVI